MKKILFASLAIISIFAASCSKSTDGIFVRFQNTLDQDIIDADYVFNEDHHTWLGLLPAGETTNYVPFEYFEVGSGSPVGFVNGRLDDGDFSAWSGQWCGTGVTYSQLEPGNYTIVISKVGSDSSGFYLLKFAQ